MKPIALNEFYNLKYLSHPTFSPSGKRFCYVTTEIKNDAYASYLYELSGKAPKQLTSAGREWSFLFLDDDTVLFPGDRDEKKGETVGTKYYRLPLDGGEAVEAYSFPIPVERLLPLENGDFIVAGTTAPGFEDLYLGNEKRAAAYLKAQKEGADYEVVDQLPFYWNGGGFTESTYTRLYYYDAKRKKLRPLTNENFAVSDIRLAKDGREVWFFGNEIKPLLPMDEGIGLYRIALPDGKPEKLFENTKDFSVLGFECAKDFAILYATEKEHGMNSDGDFYKMSYEDAKITPLCKWGLSIGSSVGSDIRHGGGRSIKAVGNTLYFIATVDDGAYLYRLEDGKIERLTGCEGSVDAFDTANGKFRCVALHNMRAQEIYDETGKQITKINEKALAGKYVATPETFVFARDGHELHGFVLKPIDYTPGKKYPVVFDIHGGPKTVYGSVFYHEMQYWASLGYFVIYTNPTGSDGRGAFADIRGKYGTDDYEDLMAFCDEALARYPDMDANNVFETGGSYGGFMTNWIVGHTDRFAACASQRSISNWFSFYGTSDIGVAFGTDQCAADPWGDREKMWEASPLKYADRCKTPTLFIHSFEDYRCPIEQGYQMYSALIAHGCEAKMVLFRGENHELSRSGKPLHRLRRLDEITKWFESHKR